ncbi:unnamed protein product [Peronospora belbahrii]|uniref:Zinc-finger domain-containing protein n=1 Tax=Peronospora belbahrii TaxID=622444 RepID=A0AAU9KS96_9STRA|nr:unnamed protein product [Peronospora belbahrii]
MSATGTTSEGSVASDEGRTVSQRLLELSKEKQKWILKRDELLVRKEKLLKVLETQALNAPKDAIIDTQKTRNDGNADKMDRSKVVTVDGVSLAQKKELKKLQTRAEAAKEKQKKAANVLARNLKQLHAKRKREEMEIEKQARRKGMHGERKNTVQEDVAVSKMHPFATALELGSRLAHDAFMEMISRKQLEKAFTMYTGKVLDEVVDQSSFERLLASQYAQEPRRSSSVLTSRRHELRLLFVVDVFVLQLLQLSVGRLQSMIQVEKEVVAGVCDTLHFLDVSELNRFELVKMFRRTVFLDHCLTGGAAIPTLSAFLCARVGVDWANPAAGNPSRILHRSYGQMAGVLENMEKWLREQSEPTEPQSDLLLGLCGLDMVSGPRVFSPKYARPFSVANESILRQLRSAGTLHSTTSKNIDPMKILCHFELNGACNDQNCSNYHQKDYEPVKELMSDTSICNADDNGTKFQKRNEADQLLLSFAEFRGRMMKRWPVITTKTPSVATVEGASWDSIVTDADTAGGVDTAVPVEKDIVRHEGHLDKSGDDFLPLDTHEKLPESGNARYFDNLDAIKAHGDMLQRKVTERPNDTNAWLLLAIYQLRLDVGMSDEAVNLSDENRLQQQLVLLSKELNAKLYGGASRVLNVEEANLNRCLHTLSCALEVEANAYCEALWLLYLHLCRHVTNRQTEIDMAEQAVQFLPSSHALWLHYISTYDFDSVSMAEGIYWRLLEHLARTSTDGSGLHASTPSSAKKLSILLTAICFHLCMKLWGAGATNRVIELLSALLQFGGTSLGFEWCAWVRSELRSEELVVFYLAYAHILLFKELPEVIEHWVVASSNANIPVKDMTYSPELFQREWCDINADICGQVLAAYDFAFRTFEKECKDDQDLGNAILNNWMLVLAYQDDVRKEDKTLHVFIEEKIGIIELYPGASLTAAKLMGLMLAGEKQACQLMLKMINCDSVTTFPEAFHHYLCACRQSPPLVDAFNKIFPDIIERLAKFVDVDIVSVQKSIQNIMRDTSNVLKSRVLKALLDTLLAAWIEQLASLRQFNRDQSMNKQTKSLANVFVALDICLLMNILLESSVAIEGIQTVLSSLSFGALSYEARQLVWMQRFVFQVDLLQQGESDGLSRREHQTILTRLFRKYMAEMSVGAEMARQVLKHVRYDIARGAVDHAVCACLYPERSHLITYSVNLEIFQLSSNAVARSELAAFYAAFTDSFTLSPEFSLAFSGIALHEWELLAARASLRKCLVGAKTKHTQILQALVAVEIRLRNMKAVSCLLESEIEADPLLLEPWRLIIGLEILFGETSDARSKSISEEIEKRQLVFACNTFGDDKILDQKNISWIGDIGATSLRLRGLGLKRIPNAVLLKYELVSLNVSGNECIELPIGLRQLKNLQKLDVSENALLEFPTGVVHGLAQLKELKLAHNNMTSFPVVPHLDFLDISWNAISHFPASALFQWTGTLRAEENAIPVDKQLPTRINHLSNQKNVASHPLTIEDSLDAHAEEKSDHSLVIQTPSASLSESTNIQRVESPISANAEISSGNLNTGHIITAQEDDGDQVMEQKKADAACKSKGHGQNLMAGTELIDHSKEDEEDQATMLENADTVPASKETNSNRIVNESTDDSSTNQSIMSSKANEQAKEVIEVDSLELSEDNGEDMTTLARQAGTIISSNTDSLVNTPNNVIDLSDLTVNKPTMASIAECRDVTTAANSRHQSSHEGAVVARNKLTKYMEEYHLDSRAAVRERNPTLWREFLAANLPANLELPACRLCFAPNDGNNQRLNSIVLCIHCLDEALLVLKKSSEQVALAQEGV